MTKCILTLSAHYYLAFLAWGPWLIGVVAANVALIITIFWWCWDHHKSNR